MEEEASDHWRLSLLFFLAKAGSAGRWSLVLNILRKLPAKHEGLEELAAHVPKSLIPKLLQLLQQHGSDPGAYAAAMNAGARRGQWQMGPCAVGAAGPRWAKSMWFMNRISESVSLWAF